MTEDKSLDVGGLGKLAEAIPEKSWNKLVNTACNTFTQLLSPITATSYGLGKLIQAKFDGMVDAQKVLSADTVARAKRKVEQSNQKIEDNPKAVILVRAIEYSSNESNEKLRDIWANIIANEIITNSIHPEFVNIVARLSTTDTAVLAEVGEETTLKEKVKSAVMSVSINLGGMGVSISSFLKEDTDFSREHLSNLHLIEYSSGQWSLTMMGEEFLKSIADPVYTVENFGVK